VTLVPEFGGALLHHLQADRPRTLYPHRSRRALRDQGPALLLRLDDGVWRIFPTFPDAEHGKTWLKAVAFSRW